MTVMWKQFWAWATLRVLVTTLLASIGVLQISDYVIERAIDSEKTTFDFFEGKCIWTAVLLSAAVVTVIKRRPRLHFVEKVPGTDHSVRVEVGDLFAGTDAVVIPVNTTFDTSVEQAALTKDNLIVQFINHGYMDQQVLDNQIDRELAQRQHVEIDDGRTGKKKEYSIGTVVPINAGNRRFYLLAILQTNEHGQAMPKGDVIIEANDRFWEFMEDRGGFVGKIRMPVLGAGSRIIGDSETQVENQIEQFLAASSWRSLGLSLTCVIWPKDWGEKKIDLSRIHQYLAVSLRRFRLSAAGAAPAETGTEEP